jgi:hypothetical protein
MHRLAWFDESADAFTLQPGPHILRVGRHAEDSAGAVVVVDLPEQRLDG